MISFPVITVKPSGKVVAATGDTLTLNCSATGDPEPVISWKRQGAALPVGRSNRINDALIIRDFRIGDVGIYICVATSAGVFSIETISDVEILARGKGKLLIVWFSFSQRKSRSELNPFVYPVSSFEEDQYFSSFESCVVNGVQDVRLEIRRYLTENPQSNHWQGSF